LVVAVSVAALAVGHAAMDAQPAFADPICVMTDPLSVLGHQVLPGLYQCIPPH
jgi:hypothetical protein